jgi:hypothetical protein
MNQLPYELILKILLNFNNIYDIIDIIFSSKQIYNVFSQNKHKIITNTICNGRDINTAFLHSAVIGDYIAIRYFVENLGMTNFRALHLSAKGGHFKIVKYLVENDVYDDDTDICHASLLSVLWNHVEITEYLDTELQLRFS